MLLQMALFHSFYGRVILHPVCVSYLKHSHVNGHLGCFCVLAMVNSGLAWRIPGTGEPGELPSMGTHRVGHD